MVGPRIRPSGQTGPGSHCIIPLQRFPGAPSCKPTSFSLRDTTDPQTQARTRRLLRRPMDGKTPSERGARCRIWTPRNRRRPCKSRSSRHDLSKSQRSAGSLSHGKSGALQAWPDRLRRVALSTVRLFGKVDNPRFVQGWYLIGSQLPRRLSGLPESALPDTGQLHEAESLRRSGTLLRMGSPVRSGRN